MIISIHYELYKITNADELFLLLHIANRLNSQGYCYPANSMLMHDTGWGIDKLQQVKKSLVEKGLLNKESRFNTDRQTSNKYQLVTGLIKIDMVQEPENIF